MSAFVLVEIKVHDPQLYESYKKLTPSSLVPFGGKFVIRGGPVELLEGDWVPERIVLLEFPDADHAKAWWESPLYAAAREIRQRSAYTKMIILSGYESAPSGT